MPRPIRIEITEKPAETPVVAGLWPWSRSWYALAVRSPGSARARWIGPRQLTAGDARVWQSQGVEGHWESSVELWRADGSQWSRV